jgi:hypothetical protein
MYPNVKPALTPPENVLLDWFGRLMRRNKPLALLGLAHGLLFAVLLIGSFGNATQVLGINSLHKPMKFALSIWAYAWTMPWLLAYLNRPRAINIYSWMAVATLGFEQWAITSQAARGQLSHFNHASTYGIVLFALMGVAILTFTLWTAYLTVLFFRQRDFPIPTAFVWGIRAGLVCFVVFSLLGGYISSLPGHTVGAADGGPGLPFANWSRAGGDLRIAHFLGIHGLQVLPLLGYGLSRATTLKKAPQWVLAGSLLYVGLVLLTLVEALAGRPLIG